MSGGIGLSPYRIMWLFVMFDLPVGTKQRAQAGDSLSQPICLTSGFEMAQFSIYLKYCPSGEKAHAISNRIPPLLPLERKGGCSVHYRPAILEYAQISRPQSQKSR